MPDSIRGGNSPDRTARFLQRIQGRHAIRTSADVQLPGDEEIVHTDRALPKYIPTDKDLGKLTEARLREIAEQDLGLTIPDDVVLKSELVELILKELNP